MMTLVLVIIAIISYCLGSLNGAIITSKMLFRKDIRKYGSGNAGLTNFYRNFGTKGALVVILVDIFKAVLATVIGGLLMGLFDEAMVGRIFAGFCAMLGHNYPVFYQFKGGKGALTGFGAMMGVDWRVGLICITLFIVLIIVTHFASVGSLAAALSAPLTVWIFGHGGLEGVVALLCFVLVAFAHRGNIVRLIKGTESKVKFGKSAGEKLKEEKF